MLDAGRGGVWGGEAWIEPQLDSGDAFPGQNLYSVRPLRFGPFADEISFSFGCFHWKKCTTARERGRNLLMKGFRPISQARCVAFGCRMTCR